MAGTGTTRTVTMTAAEYDRYLAFKGAEATVKSTGTQMEYVLGKLRELAESVVQGLGNVKNVGVLGDGAQRALELARDALSGGEQ